MTKETILITGGTGVLGKQFVRHFVENGMQVLLTSTNEDKAMDFKNSFPDSKNIKVFICDLEKIGAPICLVKDILRAGYQINHLVNNARSREGLKVNDDGMTDRETFLSEYLMHVIVPYEIAMALIKLQDRNCKTITNIGSMYGLVAANPNLYSDHLRQSPIQYGIAKAALHHLTKELAVRFAKYEIRVNCIAYGGVEGRVDEAFKARYAKLNPTGRMLNVQEVVGPLQFLIENSSSSITGHTLVADGGWSIW